MALLEKILILAACLIVHSPEIVLASPDPEFSRNNEIGSIAPEAVTNSSNISAACHFKISGSSLKKIEKLMNDRKTNVIKLNVRIELVNGIINKTRFLTDIQWANEVGRTLYSLIQLNTRFSSLHTLTAGFRDVNIFIFDENEWCSLSENTTSDHVIFDLILQQLYSISEDDTDYNLCRAHQVDIEDGTYLKYNCCAIVGENNIPICSDYSSTVTNFYPFILFTTVFFSIYVAFPLILDYLSRFKEESEYYKISDSPMALSSILHMLFIEGHGPVKSLGRKLLIVIFVLVMSLKVQTFPNSIFWYIFVLLWAFIFMICSPYKFNEDINLPQHPYLNPLWLLSTYKTPFEVIALPLNLKLWWRKVSKEWPCFYNNLKLNPEGESTERTRLEHGVQQHGNVSEDSFHNEQPGTSSEGEITELTRLVRPEVQQRGVGRQAGAVSFQRRFQQFVQIWKYRLSIMILILLYVGIAFPLSCVYTLYILLQYFWKLYKPVTLSDRLLFLPWHGYTGVLIVFISIAFFGLTFLFAIGLFLNGETYSHYFVPLTTILFYAWVNWKSSVEAKYLVLKTKIYEICKESKPVQNTPARLERNSTSEDSAETNNGNGQDQESNTFVIKLDNDDGEPIIPKGLYNKVREKFLPYDRVLFEYFLGVFPVAVFAYFLYILISLFQRSGISESAQTTGSIAATALPFIVDLVWRKNSGEQNEANSIALKSKLKRVLVVHSSDETSGKIEVEFIGGT